ncbi:hypothetical protein BU17DRAFT_52737 [Hysterangium stoloniferum]|nr:hypothetical protein BU17DRAFT_52737 [Hysterangium stoloniferum]
MKTQGVPLDTTCYNFLVQALAKEGLGRECVLLLDDMPNHGLRPDIETYNHVIFGQRWHGDLGIVEELRARMQHDGLQPDSNTFQALLLCYGEKRNLEMCLRCYGEMIALSVPPTLATVRVIINLACLLEHAKLALDVADMYEVSALRKLEGSDWMSILSASTAAYFVSNVEQVLKKFNMIPDEGQCIEMLNVAARFGHVSLAVETLQYVHNMKVPLQEHHLIPILEVYAKNRMLAQAFAVLSMMRASDILVSSITINTLVGCMNQDIDQVDEAWSMLERLHEEGKPIDIISFNAVLSAAVQLGDLQRAVGIYKAAPDFKVTPTVETYNILLSGCVEARHQQLGDKLLSEMRDLQLLPNAKTFEEIIALYLTQDTYEEAFFYLEEMKSHGFQPARRVYSMLIKKCVRSNDPRWKIAVEEMQECGYRLSRELQDFIDYPRKKEWRHDSSERSPSESNYSYKVDGGEGKLELR